VSGVRLVRAAGASAIGLAAVLALSACREEPVSRPPAAIAGDVRAGFAAMEAYGCGGCHVYPGAGRDGDAWVGPPLDHWARRSFIAGYLPNNQPNLIAWILDPDSIRPGTAMPDLGVTETDARDMAAYLLSLE
jgi:cytochrome c